jgi:hypothetical protein
MSHPHIRKAILTIAYGELFAHVPTGVPGHLSLTYDGPGLIVPVPAGVGDGPMGGMSGKELRDYLDHGMAFSGVITLRDTGDGLRLVSAQALAPITEPDAVDHMILGGILNVAEQLAGYRDVRLKAGVEVTIEDWQGVDREDKTTSDNIRLTIQPEAQRLLITSRDGRKLDLELQDGALRALAYEAEDGKQAPVITSLPASGEIRTEREDYDRETRYAPDDPEI